MDTIFFWPTMNKMARQIANLVPSCSIGNIAWNNFENGWPDSVIRDSNSVNDRDVLFLGSLESPATLFAQMSVIYALPYYGARRCRVIFPYFAPATKDRIINPGDIVTAKTLCRILSAAPRPAIGATEYLYYDIHDEHETMFFSDQVRARPLSAVPLFLDYLRDTYRLDTLAIAFPDAGSHKRFGRNFAGYPQIICNKDRIGDSRRVWIAEGDPKGKKVIIVDDLVNTGGTALACKDALFHEGAKSVEAYFTHGVFPQKTWQKFIDVGFDRIWITDSCPETAKQVEGLKPFLVISLAQDIARVIKHG